MWIITFITLSLHIKHLVITYIRKYHASFTLKISISVDNLSRKLPAYIHHIIFSIPNCYNPEHQPVPQTLDVSDLFLAPSLSVSWGLVSVLTSYWVVSRKMATVSPETEAHATAVLSLLSLPGEVRNMIYRLLLVADSPLGCETEKELDADSKPIWANFGEYHLHPAILRVCRQLNRETSSILNGENTFGIQIYGFDDRYLSGTYSKAKTVLLNFQLDFDSRSFPKCVAPIKKFQRFEILIDSADGFSVGLEVLYLCFHMLNEMPALQHICLHFLHDTSHTHHEILKAFEILRILRSVIIHGVSLPYAEHLRKLMLRNTPWKYTSYHALKGESLCTKMLHTKCVKQDPVDFEKLSKAVLELIVEILKEIGSVLLSAGQRHMQALLHIFKDDAKSEKGDEATIEQSSGGQTAEDCRAKVEDGHDGKIEEDHNGEVDEDLKEDLEIIEGLGFRDIHETNDLWL